MNNAIIYIDDVEFRTIKEYDDYAIGFNGELYSFKSGRLLKTYMISKGYIGCKLYKNNIGKSYKIHRLVAKYFIANIDNKPQVNHKNSVRDDNNVENLEWVDNKENSHHGKSSKLTTLEVEQIRKMINNGTTIYKLAEIYNVAVSTISHIKTGRNWY